MNNDFEKLRKKFMKVTPSDDIKFKNGQISNWDDLSPELKDWIKNG